MDRESHPSYSVQEECEEEEAGKDDRVSLLHVLKVKSVKVSSVSSSKRFPYHQSLHSQALEGSFQLNLIAPLHLNLNISSFHCSKITVMKSQRQIESG